MSVEKLVDLVEGAGLHLGEGDEVTVDFTDGGEAKHTVYGVDAADENTDTRLVLDYMKATGDGLLGNAGSEATVTVKGVAHTVHFAS